MGDFSTISLFLICTFYNTGVTFVPVSLFLCCHNSSTAVDLHVFTLSTRPPHMCHLLHPRPLYQDFRTSGGLYVWECVCVLILQYWLSTWRVSRKRDSDSWPPSVESMRLLLCVLLILTFASLTTGVCSFTPGRGKYHRIKTPIMIFLFLL